MEEKYEQTTNRHFRQCSVISCTISDNFNILQTTDVYEYNNVWLIPQQSSLTFTVKACGEVNLGLANVAGDNSTIQLRVLIGGFDNQKSRIYYNGLSVRSCSSKLG